MEFAWQQRAMAVLQASFTQLYATWNVLMEAMCVGMAVLNLYLAVELRSVRALILALGVGVSYCFGIKELGQVYETSKGILTSWKSSSKFESNHWCRKFMRSGRPNFVPLGTLFYVDSKFVLTVLGIIINGAASLILANQHRVWKSQCNALQLAFFLKHLLTICESNVWLLIKGK